MNGVSSEDHVIPTVQSFNGKTVHITLHITSHVRLFSEWLDKFIPMWKDTTQWPKQSPRLMAEIMKNLGYDYLFSKRDSNL
jgi:hypothetical protein